METVLGQAAEVKSTIDPGTVLTEIKEPELTAEEEATIKNYMEQLDITDSSQIMTYGANTQSKMADFSGKALESVRAKDMGEIGNLLTGVVGELRGIGQDEDRGFFGNLFKKQGDKLAAMKAQYDKAEVNVGKIVNALEDHETRLMKDSATLDKMYDMNLEYYRDLSMQIIAGKRKLEEAENVTLPALRAKADETGEAADAQAVRDYQEKLDRFSKKITDLELTRTIAMQTAPQIRMIQTNDMEMVDKIHSTIVNTIPLWKSQMVLALGIENASQAAKAQRAVSDVTNKMLLQNAEALKMATIETEKESQRGIVDIETLQKTNENLISTFDEVMRIQAEGREKRAAAEEQMQKMENELKAKLLEVRK